MMSTTVSLPSVGPDASLAQILLATATRLQSVADVLLSEQKWLTSTVEWNRQINGGEEDIDRQLKAGWIDEETAEQKRKFDDLTIEKAKVDKHLTNLDRAVLILADAGETLRRLTPRPKEDAA